MKFGINSAILLKKNLIVSLYAMKNNQKIKKNLMKEKSIKIFIMIKCQNVIVLIYQWY